MEDLHARVSDVGLQQTIPMQLAGGSVYMSPKRPSAETSGLADIFPYYAGFSYDWAYEQVRTYCPSESSVVLDPWNGSGTATFAAQQVGHRAIGIDLNPVANLVAALRCTPLIPRPCEAPRHQTLRVTKARLRDPLDDWLEPKTVHRIREWTSTADTLEESSRALLFVAVFRAVRKLTAAFEGSNPTWVKRSKSSDELLHYSVGAIDETIEREMAYALARLSSVPIGKHRPIILTASSSSLPLADNSTDFVITSPPYLTRIDYGVAYSRELAVLGVDLAQDRSLRTALMGTTIIRPEAPLSGLGQRAQSLLSGVYEHTSHASKSYYLKQTRQYLGDLTCGLDEVTRVAKSGARFCFVVQDSFYKDVPVPLAAITVEESERRGWTVEAWDRFPVKRSLTSVNTPARKYEKGEVAESVVRVRLT